MAQKLETFINIVDAVGEALGVQRDDTNARNKIKRFINMTYMDEVVPFKNWPWLQKTTEAVHKAYYSVGTVTVTPTSTTVTFGTAPNVSLGSFKGYKFSINGSNKVYTIATHTAASTTAVLTSAYQEDLNSAAEYKIWRDRIDLPTTAKETVEIWHSEQGKPLDAVGSQGLRKLEARSPKQEGFATHYNTSDFFDPSSGDGEAESDRYRQVRIFPAITATPLTLNIDYIQEVTELDDDADEPLMPNHDRIVLFYAATAMGASIINRNEEMHDRYHMKYEQKLARMAGNREEGMDTPALKPTSSYLNNIRRSGLKRRTLVHGSGGGASSVTPSTYLEGVTINGANVTGNLTVATDIMIDGRDISDDGALLDDLANTTTVTLTDNTTNQVVATFLAATYDVVHVQYSIKRGATREAGMITLVTDGSTVSIAQGGVASIGAPGVTLSADISSGSIRLLSTTSSTGSAASFEYRQFRWLM